ncbi:hypothetical protein NQ315_017456 [Exocentrus adspersus]|uniref:Uncharacterized protein n=1 Tax=Exocentrus adspersus TaxID=1586481 RepID=A0AAV8VKQ4_9CUCU|nr:hypothetical protein NQ315_017456 [Exocentrus adspersus]
MVAMETSSDVAKNYPGGREILKQAFLRKNIPNSAVDVLISSITKNTLKQYNNCYKKWWIHCKQNEHQMYTYNLQSALEFLHFHFSSGVSYSTLNCYKSALSLILDINDSDERILKRFLKGAFNIKPSSPRYSITWDPRPVLEHLETLMPLTSLTLQNLTLKLVTLLALISAHRIQTLTKISLENIVHYADRVEIRIPQRVKTTAPGRLQPNLVLPYFKDRPGLCAAMTLKTYINVTTTISHINF